MYVCHNKTKLIAWGPPSDMLTWLAWTGDQAPVSPRHPLLSGCPFQSCAKIPLGIKLGLIASKELHPSKPSLLLPFLMSTLYPQPQLGIRRKSRWLKIGCRLQNKNKNLRLLADNPDDSQESGVQIGCSIPKIPPPSQIFICQQLFVLMLGMEKE